MRAGFRVRPTPAAFFYDRSNLILKSSGGEQVELEAQETGWKQKKFRG